MSDENQDGSQLDLLRAELGAQYEILRLIGKGGMGAVYLARELSLDRLVALKVLPSDLIDSETSRERFRREARMAARLNHPSIVPLFSYGETASVLYYVMGFVDGESLQDRIGRLGTLPGEELQDLVRSLCEALDHAHRKGVIHRDIKPSNILIDGESGRVLLTDFGISRAYGAVSSESAPGSEQASPSLTRTGAVMGTPTYMAPEQATGSKIDARTDIYSLAITTYEAATGEVPFSGPTANVVLAKKLVGKYTPLVTARPDLKRGFSKTIDKCLDPKPSRRPDTTERVLILMEGFDRRASEQTKVFPIRWAEATLWGAILTVVGLTGWAGARALGLALGLTGLNFRIFQLLGMLSFSVCLAGIWWVGKSILGGPRGEGKGKRSVRWRIVTITISIAFSGVLLWRVGPASYRSLSEPGGSAAGSLNPPGNLNQREISQLTIERLLGADQSTPAILGLIGGPDPPCRLFLLDETVTQRLRAAGAADGLIQGLNDVALCGEAEPGTPQARPPSGQEAETHPLVIEETRTPDPLGPEPSEESGTPFTGKRWALLVDVDRFLDGRIPAMGGPARKDAHSVAEFLQSERAGLGGFHKENVLFLEGSNATYRGILSGLASLERQLTEEDLVLLFFSLPGLGEVGVLRSVTHLLAYDSDSEDLSGTSLRFDELWVVVESLPSRNTIVLIDATILDPSRALEDQGLGPEPPGIRTRQGIWINEPFEWAVDSPRTIWRRPGDTLRLFGQAVHPSGIRQIVVAGDTYPPRPQLEFVEGLPEEERRIWNSLSRFLVEVPLEETRQEVEVRVDALSDGEPPLIRRFPLVVAAPEDVGILEADRRFSRQLAGSTGGFVYITSHGTFEELSRDFSKAAEVGKDEMGLFTHSLLLGLKGEAEEDGNQMVTIEEWIDYVRRKFSAERRPIPEVSRTLYDPSVPLSVVPDLGRKVNRNPGSGLGH